MANPNNCATCDHKRIPDGGHCYMFRDVPTEVCMQHSGRQSSFISMLERQGFGRALRVPKNAPPDIIGFAPAPLTCLSCGAEGHKDQPLVCGH